MPSAPSARTRVRRAPARGTYDRATIDAILDEALVCHLGFVHDGQPYVIPTIHARDGDRLVLHGSTASRALKVAGVGVPVCVTVTLLDGLVLARSAFHHSMNYRSVVVLGEGHAVDDPAEKTAALERITEHVAPGRWSASRQPSAGELAATTVMALSLDEASAKVRSGPPVDDAEDHELDVWAGVIPLRLERGEPIRDPQLRSTIPTPESLQVR